MDGRMYRFALALFAMLVFCGPAALAADPLCNWFPTFVVDSDPLPDGAVLYPPVDVIDATGPPPADALPPGSFHYCVAQWDGDGLRYPLTGHPIACEVRLEGQVLDRQEGLAPGQLVIVPSLDVRWEVDLLSIACSNSVAEGVAFERPAIFPAAAPGQPYVPSD